MTIKIDVARKVSFYCTILFCNFVIRLFLQNLLSDEDVNHFLLAENPQQVVFFKDERNVRIGHGKGTTLQAYYEAIPFMTQVGCFERSSQ